MTVQELEFELIKKASFNDFDGEKVVASLQENRDLWRGVVMDRAAHCFHGPEDDGVKISLIKLRDIESDEWNVDTLFILPQPGCEDQLMELARWWGADEVDWIEGRQAAHMLGYGSIQEVKILRVWFD